VTVTAVDKDPQRLTMTIEAEFDASPERVWQLWGDPRQLERWWGPPGYPATVTRHDLKRGSHVVYQMIGAEGDQHHGYWEILEADAPHRLVFRDGLANADGTPNTDMPPATTRVTIEEVTSGAPACPSRVAIRASRPWSGSWARARTWGERRPLARSMPSSPNKGSGVRSRGEPL
jgi:uncharacterized protein YndB with AHSA1/START domain